MKYKITFHTFWHCSSGQAAGADVDQLVKRDKGGIPYLPGRTMKGLLREAAEELAVTSEEQELVTHIFGGGTDDEPELEYSTKGIAHFSNAELPSETKAYLLNDKKKALPYLFNKVAATAIDDEGIAVNASFRKIEVVVPCTLYGEIDGIEREEERALLQKAMGFIKCMGAGRSRGYGRCTIKLMEEDK